MLKSFKNKHGKLFEELSLNLVILFAHHVEGIRLM